YVADGSVYFDLRAWRAQAAYGRLFTVDTESFRDGVRIDAEEYERDSVSDFVLWKARKEGEPSWDFTITVDGADVDLPGRPGWHIECSAMGKELLGLPFDIHTGGVDLRFPHHEDEIAQSEAGYGTDPARMWCHNEFLEVEGKKMSKSLGNYFTLRDLLARGHDARDIRYALMAGQYGSVLNFTFDGLVAAAKARARVQDLIHDVWSASGTATHDVAPMRAAVMSALADNLHTPRALAALFKGLAAMAAAPASQLDAASREAALRFFREINDVFAVWDIGERPAAQPVVIPDDVRRLAEERWNAKQSRDFARADAIRAEISAAGWLMKDRKDGFDLEPADAS
ncbi:MAG: cysteine--tRNA ligase, partial [Candidatus Kapaibacterium sp.]